MSWYRTSVPLIPTATLLLACALGCGTSANSPAPGGVARGVPAGTEGAVQTAPSAGYVWSAEDHTLRAISGILGAARLGDNLLPTGGYVAGGASSASAVALLVDSSNNLVSLPLPAGATNALGHGFGAGTLVRFAPSGAMAAVFAPGSAGFLLISGLPASALAHTLASPAGLLDAAVSDKGTVLAFSAAANGVNVTLLPNGGTAPLTTLGRFGGAAFVPGSDDAVVVDGAARTLALWRGLATAPSRTVSALPEANNPLGVGVSRDGRWAVVADGGDAKLLRVDLSGALPPRTLACPCQPSAVEALAGNARFRVSQSTVVAGVRTPLWTIDAGPSEPRLVFVPAPATRPGIN